MALPADLEQGQLLALVVRAACRERAEPVGRRPVAARPRPAKAGQIHPLPRVEDDPLGLQELALQRTAGADAARAIDDPLPFYRAIQFSARSDGTCAKSPSVVSTVRL